MNQKKTPEAAEATASAQDSAIVTQPKPARKLILSGRQARAVDAMKGGEWVIREALDRIAGASNSPDLIQQLMRKFGHDAIERERFDAIDRDGRACRPGRYRFNAIGLERLAKFEAANDSGEAAA
jgi:hypothetical protein